MPGPQPRRAFQQRLASAARRGAYGPPGAPGVYRVPRRTVSAVVSDAGLAAAVSSEWVQPDDVTAVYNVTTLYMTGAWLSNYSVDAFGINIAGDGVAEYLPFEDPPYSFWGTSTVILDASGLDCPPVSPTPPPGMTVEYENPTGVPIDVLLRGTVRNLRNGAGPDPVACVWELLTADIVPGYAFGLGPVNTTVQGALQFSTSVVDGIISGSAYSCQPFETASQTFPVEGRVGWRVGSESAAFHEDMTSLPQYATRLYGVPQTYIDGVPVAGSSILEAEYTYTPPRYRFV